MIEKYPLPDGWRWAKIKDVIQDALSGFACGKRDIKDGTAQLRMNNITTNGQLDLSSIIKVPASEEQIKKYKLNYGDVIFNNTNSAELVGKTALFEGRDQIFLYSNHLTRLRPSSDILDPVFLLKWLNLQWNQRVFEQICNRWIGQAAVQKEKLFDLDIPIPPLPEQLRIAAKIQELIQEIDRAKAACEKQLGAANSLQSAYLRSVFESEEAKKWERKKLGEICELIMGQSPPGESYNTEKIGLPFFQGKVDFTDYYPTVRLWCSQPMKIAKEGDILISVRAPVGPVNMSNMKCCIGRGLAAIRCKEQTINWFIFWYLVYIEKMIASLGSGSTFNAIARADLTDLLFPIAPQEEQRRIVAKLRELIQDEEGVRFACEKQKEIMQIFPQAILNKAFKGEL
jgi:type I restriction enzyme S subunit